MASMGCRDGASSSRRTVRLGARACRLLVLYPTLTEVLSAPDYAVDNSQSSKVEALLEQSLRGAGSELDALVFYSRDHRVTDSAYRAVVRRVLRATRSQTGVTSVIGPYGGRGVRAVISTDRRAAVARVALGGDPRTRFKNAAKLQQAIARASGGGVQAWLTGFSSFSKDLAQVETADAERAEAIGVPVALVILLVALGALAAASIPLLLAGASLLLTYGLIALLARVLNFDVFLLTIRDDDRRGGLASTIRCSSSVASARSSRGARRRPEPNDEGSPMRWVRRLRPLAARSCTQASSLGCR